MALELAGETQGAGPPLVVLHGLFGSSSNWRSFAAAMADTREVVALAEDVLATIRERGLDRPALLGHSMGGKVAMALALHEPAAIGKLIVADIAPRDYGPTLTPYVDAMRAVDLLAASTRGGIQRQLQALLPDPSVAPFLAQNLITRDQHFDWRINLAAIGAAMHELGGFPPALRERRFERTMHVIAGANSDYVRAADGSEFAPMFPLAEVAFIEGAGHWVHADRPQAFAEAVRRALADDAA